VSSGGLVQRKGKGFVQRARELVGTWGRRGRLLERGGQRLKNQGGVGEMEGRGTSAKGGE